MSWDLLASILILVSLPGSLELAFLTFSAWAPAPSTDTRARRTVGQLALVVPAHNEAASIADTIESLQACAQASPTTALVVVADNCTDDTGSIAAALGARVLYRNDPHRRGKGYALDFAFQQLLQDGFDAFIVIDADTVADRNLLTAFARRFDAGADALQCVYRAPGTDDTPATRMRNIIWFAFNVVRPRARSFWGLSVGIYGNGFGITRETLARVPYDVGSITEDLDYHLRLVSAGLRVEWVSETTVWSKLPAATAATESQRARWEGGRARAFVEWSPKLLRALLRGQWRAFEPLLDLWLLPLAYHAIVLSPLLVIPVNAGRVYAASGFLLLALHAMTAVRLGWQWKDMLVLFRIPFYVLWKIRMLPQILAKVGKEAAWVRTDRMENRQ